MSSQEALKRIKLENDRPYFGRPLEEQLRDPYYIKDLKQALELYDLSLERRLTGWLYSIALDTGSDTLGTYPEIEGRRPFVNLSARIRRGEIDPLDEEGPFPEEIRRMIGEKFPQEFLPFDKVPYKMFPCRRWIEHPDFHHALQDAVADYNPDVEEYMSFRIWLSSVEYDDESDQWKLNTDHNGPWRKVARAIPRATIIVGNESPLPEDLQEEMRKKFPREFQAFEDTPYHIHPKNRWLYHPGFQEVLRKALTLYDPNQHGQRIFTGWLRSVSIDKESGIISFNKQSIGPFQQVANHVLTENISVTGDNSPLPEDIKSLIKTKFIDSRPFIYFGLTIEEQVRHPVFLSHLKESLERYDRHDNRTFTGWLASVTYDPVLKKWGTTPEVKGKKPFHSLSAKIRSGDIDLLGDDSPLPDELKDQIRQKFPQPKRGYFGRRIKNQLAHPEFHADMTRALHGYDPEEEQIPFAKWLLKVVYDEERDEWGIHPSMKGKRPFVNLSNMVRKGKVCLLGKDSPLPKELQVLIKEKFPHVNHSFEEKPYRLFPSYRWLEHPQFHQQLRQALRSYDPAQHEHIAFRSWLNSITFNTEKEQWELSQKRRGDWNALDNQIRLRNLTFVGDDSSLPEDIQAILKEKFPLDFKNPEEIDYTLLPSTMWLEHPGFQNDLADAVKQYDPERDGYRTFLGWLGVVKFDKEQGLWKIGANPKGPWYNLANGRLEGKVVVGEDSPLSSSLQTSLLEKFPRDFGRIKDVKYQSLTSSRWLEHPLFHSELERALRQLNEPPGISFIHWLKTVRPYDEIWEAKHAARAKTNPGPWKRLASYCETHRIKRGGNWRDLFVGENSSLPDNIQRLIQEYFPQNFLRPEQVDDYTLLQTKDWLLHHGFQRQLVDVLKQYDSPPGISFLHWLKYVDPNNPLPDDRGWNVNGFGKWSGLAAYIAHKRTKTGKDLASIIDDYPLHQELTNLLTANFPEDFLSAEEHKALLYGSPEARVDRITKALNQAGFQPSSSTILAQHLISRYPIELTESLNINFTEFSTTHTPHGDGKAVKGINFLLNVERIVTKTLEETATESDTTLQSFVNAVIGRLIREDLYESLGRPNAQDVDTHIITSYLNHVEEQLKEVLPDSSCLHLRRHIESVRDQVFTALRNTSHLQDFFTHGLTLEQILAIEDIAAGPGNTLLAHLPGEGKTAMALAGAWEYFRRNGKMSDSIVLFLGSVSAVSNLQEKGQERLNQNIPNQFTIVDWRQADLVTNRYDILRNAVRKQQTAPLVLPISYSMIQNKVFLQDLNTLLIQLNRSGKQVVLVADEVHHTLGLTTVDTLPGYHETPVIPISGLSPDRRIIAVEKAQSFTPIDYLLRAADKTVLMSGTPLNTDTTQLVHLASLLESKAQDGKIFYPSYDRVKDWIKDPVSLSAALHQRMHRSSHLTLPDVQRIILLCDFTDLSEIHQNQLTTLLQAKSGTRLWQISVEVETVLPFILSLLSKHRQSPAVISVPYVHRDKATGLASAQRVVSYLQHHGMYGSARLDSTITEKNARSVIQEFRDDEGTNTIVLSPAFAESRDLHSRKKPTCIVVSIGASTLRGYEQAVRRVVRPGNPAERVFVITPIPVNFPEESLLAGRNTMLQERLITTAAILDPVSLVRPVKEYKPDDLHQQLTQEFETESPADTPLFEIPDEPYILDDNESTSQVWNTGSVLEYATEMKNDIFALEWFKKPIEDKGFPEIKHQLLERGQQVHKARSQIAQFILTEAAFIKKQLDSLQPNHGISYQEVLDQVTNVFSRFTEVSDNIFLKTIVLDPAVEIATNSGIMDTSYFVDDSISDRVLLIALRQQKNTKLQNMAWNIIAKRYTGYIHSAFAQFTTQEIEDIEQEIWLQLMESTYLPYGSLHGIIKKIGKQVTRKTLHGTNSVQALDFTDFTDNQDDRSFEETGVVYSIDKVDI